MKLNPLDLIPFATTDRQREVLAALAENDGNQHVTARALNTSQKSVWRIFKACELRASQRGFAPDYDVTAGAPPGYMMRGTSTLYGADGEVKLQWHKTKEDIVAQWEALQEAVHDLFKDVPRAEPRPIDFNQQLVSADLLALYPEGDPHWGMRVWHEETGDASYDLDIALKEYYAATDYLVSQALPAQEALLLNIGDNFHADGPENLTRRSGNALQVDGRLAKVFRTVVQARRYRIDRCLEKHHTVRVREVLGNHDEVLGMGFTQALKGYYHNEPRVIIEDSPREFWYHRFGKVLFGATHGHKVKIADLPSIMACDRPEDWGVTKHRHFYIGHQHHMERLEMRGVVAEMLRTLAARNEFEDSHGYRSTRDMMVRCFHREFGEVTTVRMGWELLRALQGGAA